MKKYYAIWDKRRGKWWIPDSDISESTFYNITKMIGAIPVWDDPSFFDNANKWNIRDYKMKEFTPADALLAKCGKT